MRFLRITLGVAALMTALGAWLFADPSSALAQQYELPNDAPILYRALLGFVLTLFAGMYAWMAAQPTAVRPLLWLGVFGKGGAFALAVALLAMSRIPASTAAMLVGDGVLASVWLAWLYWNRASDVPMR